MDDEGPRYMYYGPKKEDVRDGRSEETVRFTRFRCVNKYIFTNIAFFLPSLSLSPAFKMKYDTLSLLEPLPCSINDVEA